MAERRVIFRDGKNPLYLSGFREGHMYIRGRVDNALNGEYNVCIKKSKVDGELWSVHETHALSQCNERNQLGWCNPKTMVVIEVPDHIRGDHHVIVKWAEGQVS